MPHAAQYSSSGVLALRLCVPLVEFREVWLYMRAVVLAGGLGRILSEKRFYELVKAENKTSVETSEVDIALSALKVSDIDARAHGLNDYKIAVARDWARLIRTKSRRGILCYKTGNQRLNLIFNNPGTKR